MGCFHSKTTNFGDIALWWILSQWGLEGAGPGAGVQGDDLESMETIVSENGEKAPNVVYRGKFEGGWLVAVKRFSKQSWPDAQQFVAEAVGVGKLRHNNISSTDGDPRLSSFGLIKNIRDGKSYSTNLAYTPPEFMRTGLYVDLLGSIFLLVISYKREKHFEARDRPNSKFLLSAVEPLQTQKEVASHTGYKDEEGAENELSFQESTQQVQEMLNTKKFGDIAFRDKDFKSAIEYYSKALEQDEVWPVVIDEWPNQSLHYETPSKHRTCSMTGPPSNSRGRAADLAR
ncbi:hypothetical protein OPV22_035043 [Ensete ventricosum]|uniref:Serine/threonine-protein kinase BSK1-like TPR repeats domain-containing protein n=1 Tax=Ensete ventricosum TaxID=4639 RepID=A0AAV8PRS4_ENSVE|nr:hypothetical protein OPV22_035043 [Ensete ventricosum]